MANRNMLTEEQLAAVSELSKTNKYEHQSKWKTFKELPRKDKWPYFVQHYLLGVAIIVVVLAFVIGLGVTIATKPADAKLYIAGVNMDASSQLEELKQGFVEQSGLDGELVTTDSTATINPESSDGYSDSTMQLFAMVSAGQINTIVSDKDTMTVLDSERGLVSPLSDVLTKSQIAALRDADAVIEMKSAENGNTVAAGIDLTKSEVWQSIKGTSKLGDDVVLSFANVTETGTEYPRALVDYLFGL